MLLWLTGSSLPSSNTQNRESMKQKDTVSFVYTHLNPYPSAFPKHHQFKVKLPLKSSQA